MIQSTRTYLRQRCVIDDSVFFLSIKLVSIFLSHNALCLERSVDGPGTARIHLKLISVTKRPSKTNQLKDAQTSIAE